MTFSPMHHKIINFRRKFDQFTEHWAPKVVAEMIVVPRGVEHKPSAENEVQLLLIEPRGVLNTGHEGGARTAENDVWI